MTVIGQAWIEIKPEVSRFAGELGTGVTKAVDKVAAESKGSFTSLSNVGRAALLGITAAAGGLGTAAIHLADQWESAHARLTTALTDTGTSIDQVRGQVTALDSRMEKFGFTNADTESALAKLQIATKSTAKSVADMSLATDIARGRNISLEAASALLVKVETGHVALLGRLGINIKDVNGQTISQEEALRRLSNLYGGQASAYAQTFAGKMSTLKASAEDLGKNLGMVLIPVVEKVASTLAAGAKWLEQHRAAAAALATVVGTVLVTAMTAYIATQTKALAMQVASFFTSIGKAVLGAGEAAAEGAVQLTLFSTAEEAAGAASIGMAAVLGPLALLAGAAALAVTLFGNSSHKTTVDISGLTDALVKSNLAFDTNARQAIGAALANKGLVEPLKALGINIATVIDALSGDAKAHDDVLAVMGRSIDTTKFEANEKNLLAQALGGSKHAYDLLGESLATHGIILSDSSERTLKLARDLAALGNGTDAATQKARDLIIANAAAADSADGASAANDAQTTSLKALADAMKQASTDAKAVNKDQVALAKAQASVSKETEAANKSVADAMKAAERAADSAQKAISSAEKTQAKDAEASAKAIVDANNKVIDAQKKLTDAMQPATPRTLSEATDALTTANIDVTSKTEDVATAQADLAALQAKGGATAQELTDAQNKVTLAQIALRDANNKVTDAQDALTAAQKKGTDSDQAVVDAKANVQTAVENAAQVQQDAADRAISDAQAVSDAMQASAESQQASNDAIATAREQAAARIQAANDAVATAQDTLATAEDTLATSSDNLSTTLASTTDDIKSLTPTVIAAILAGQDPKKVLSMLLGNTSDLLPVKGAFAEGGLVPGPTGAPAMIKAHGGEFVLSNDMIRGIKPTSSGGGGGGSSGRMEELLAEIAAYLKSHPALTVNQTIAATSPQQTAVESVRQIKASVPVISR